MAIRDRVAQFGVATSSTAITMNGAADTKMLTFEQGFQMPTVAQLAGTVTWRNVPVSVERLDGSWGTHLATITRDGSNNVVVTLVSTIATSNFNVSTRAFDSYGLANTDAVLVEVTPSAGQFGMFAAAPRDPHTTWNTGDGEGIVGATLTPRVQADALLCIGQGSQAGNYAVAGSDGAVAIGYNAGAATEAWSAPGAYALGYQARQQWSFGAVLGGDNGSNVNPFTVALAANGRGITVGAKKLYQFPRKGILSLVTTNATPDQMQNYDETGAPIASSGVLFIDTGITRIKGSLMAYEPATGDKKLWNVDALVHTNAAYSSTSVIGTPDYTELHEDAGATAWTFALVCDNGASTVAIEVTGEAAHTIAWSFIYDADCHEVW